jgi:hypothetical protein
LVNEQEEVIFKEEAVSSGHCSFGAWCLRTANLSIPGDLNRITINAWGLYASRFDNLKIGIPCSNFSSTYAIYLPLINKGPDIYPFGMNPAAPNLTHSFDYPVAPVSASSVKESLPGTQPDNYTVDKSQFLDETKITLESNNHLTPQIIIISPTINLDHETGNLSQYSGTSAFGSSQVTVVNSAAYNSSYGLKVDTIAGSGANQAWAYKTLSPWPMNQMAVGFYFNSTGIIGNTSDSIEIFEIDSNGPDFANIRLIKATGGGTSIEVNLFDGDGFSPPKKVTEVVSNGWHKVEIVMDEATTGIATDGRATVWFDGVLLNSFTGLNNYNLFNNVETVYFGLFDRLPSSNNIAGTVLIDEIVIGTSSFALYLPFISKGPDIYPFGVNPATSDLTHSFVD